MGQFENMKTLFREKQTQPKRTISPTASVYYGFHSEFGAYSVFWNISGVYRIDTHVSRRAAKESYQTSVPKWILQLQKKLDDYLNGQEVDFQDTPLDLSWCTDFQKRVYKVLLKVPYGQTIAYAQLAARAGSPGAMRAVGTTMATNSIPILIPCHRVVRSDGTIGQYSGFRGSESKRMMLEMERRLNGEGVSSLFDFASAPRIE